MMITSVELYTFTADKYTSSCVCFPLVRSYPDYSRSLFVRSLFLLFQERQWLACSEATVSVPCLMIPLMIPFAELYKFIPVYTISRSQGFRNAEEKIAFS